MKHMSLAAVMLGGVIWAASLAAEPKLYDLNVRHQRRIGKIGNR
ncbi:MAG: hypothetical protein ACYS9T_10245 [Planctomycetota bacterium]|jgi:hypothetical protein